jgi:hypothetical protein
MRSSWGRVRGAPAAAIRPLPWQMKLCSECGETKALEEFYLCRFGCTGQSDLLSRVRERAPEEAIQDR